jgi:DNA-binding NarL/FixJ family response regulator
MATILLLGVDLYIRGKLEAVVPEHRFQTADGVEPPDLVIADIARIEPVDVTDSYPDVPVLGYTNHTDTAGLRGAHAAGFDQVVAKSALFERTRELIDQLLTTVE